MNTRTTLFAAAAFVALVGSVATFAAEDEQEPARSVMSTMSRADVRATATLADGEASCKIVASAIATPLERARVMAEARAALRLGLVPMQEGTRAATADDLASIALAGRHALDMPSLLVAR